ncbi:MAG: hypothetical protein F6J92_23740 [Symploca sp. SIO1A3]|nr:hypothetical protein [Symploca sp. SIO1A3]
MRSAVLLPSTITTSVVIAIARANANLPQEQRFEQLLGGDVLYSPDTLRQAGSAVEGLVLAVAWHDENTYAQEAEHRWNGKINWRTAMSFDAAKVLTKALSRNATRETVLDALKSSSMYLPGDETSGDELRFDKDGESTRNSRLVQVVRGGSPPLGSQWSFERID